MELLIKQGNIDLDANSEDGRSAMHAASIEGSIEVSSPLSQAQASMSCEHLGRLCCQMVEGL